MPRRKNQEYARVQTNSLSADEAEKLFATVDETGHTNEETAARQRRHRKDTGNGVDVDPLAGEDPSGSNIGKTIAKAASAFVIIAFAVIVGSQIYFGYVRRENTANLSQSVSVTSVAKALDAGVEWGNGFTQFPEDYSVQEADQNTGRIEVTVTDTTSETPLEVVAGSQVQATAFSVNSLLNPNIDTVIYHVQVHKDQEGNIQRNSFFGFFRPAGELKPFMTFIWTKSVDANGEVKFNCTITGLDDDLQEELRTQITSRFTPTSILSVLPGGKDDADAGSSEKGSASDAGSAAVAGSAEVTDAGSAEAGSSAASDATADASTAAATTESAGEAGSAAAQ